MFRQGNVLAVAAAREVFAQRRPIVAAAVSVIVFAECNQSIAAGAAFPLEVVSLIRTAR